MVIEPLADVEDLEGRLEFPLDDPHLKDMARNVLIDASVLVCEYGDASWGYGTAPPIAVVLTLKAAARHMNNPMFLETARGADETNMWGGANANGVHLEPTEIELLDRHRKNRRGFVSVNTNLYSHAKHNRYTARQNAVPVHGYGTPDTAKYWPLYERGDVYDPFYPPEG